MESFAQSLSEKTVIDSSGAVVGKLHNITFSYKTGSIENLIVSPNNDRLRRDYEQTNQNRYLVPSERVSAVKDKIVVDAPRR